jgi:hypothetical protein
VTDTLGCGCIRVAQSCSVVGMFEVTLCLCGRALGLLSFGCSYAVPLFFLAVGTVLLCVPFSDLRSYVDCFAIVSFVQTFLLCLVFLLASAYRYPRSASNRLYM